MSTTQELEKWLRDYEWASLSDALRDLAEQSKQCRTEEGGRIPTWPLLEAADRLASLSAENDALKVKLVGVDEKALEAGAVAIHARHEALTHWVKTLKREPRPFEASGIKEVHRLDARAAIAAYLAAVGGGE